jgi:acyl dehydratase
MTLTKTVTRVQIAKYAAATGDFNALHFDDDHARRAGMDGVIAHGLLSLGFVGQAITDLAGGRPEDVRSVSLRFKKPVRPGDTVVVQLDYDGDPVDGVRAVSVTVRVGDLEVGSGRASILGQES